MPLFNIIVLSFFCSLLSFREPPETNLLAMILQFCHLVAIYGTSTVRFCSWNFDFIDISAEKSYCPGAVLSISHIDAIGSNPLLYIWLYDHNILDLGMLRMIIKHCLFGEGSQ